MRDPFMVINDCILIEFSEKLPAAFWFINTTLSRLNRCRKCYTLCRSRLAARHVVFIGSSIQVSNLACAACLFGTHVGWMVSNNAATTTATANLLLDIGMGKGEVMDV